MVPEQKNEMEVSFCDLIMVLLSHVMHSFSSQLSILFLKQPILHEVSWVSSIMHSISGLYKAC